MKKAILFLFALSCNSAINLIGQTLFVPSGINGVSFSDRNGSIGIGTSSPRAYFDVYPLFTNSLKSVLARLSEGDQSGEGTFLGVRSYNSQPETNQPCCNIKSFALEHAFYSQINSSINFYRGGSITGGFITFNTNDNTERMRIDMNGNVGIGTATPNSQLNVIQRSLGRIAHFSEHSDLVGEGTEGFISSGYSPINIGSHFSYNGAYGFIEMNGGTRAISIKLNGNVGIGTTDPKNLLDVKGTIHAQEVKVDMNNWSDFVFHPSYHLKPLMEVEKFIKTNGHLQDIPSAAEVEQNGVNVGEMQKKLLQKVEELTLYVIEKDKEINRLKEMNQKLLELQTTTLELQRIKDENLQTSIIALKFELEAIKGKNISTTNNINNQ